MERAHDTMMNPPIEELLDRVDSKFGLVTLAARRARNINAYFNQLGEGLGHMVPPQVSSVARKPLSIGFEEIAADKIKLDRPPRRARAGRRRRGVRRARAAPTTPTPPPSPDPDLDAGRLAHRPRRHRRDRRLQGRRGLPPPRRRRRPRHPGDDQGRRALRRPHDAQRPGQRAGADRAVGRPDPIPHTRLGQQADLVIVAPATARIIGAYAAGLSTDLLTNVLLATRAPVLICPAMHTEMWEHPAVVENLATLRRRGVHVVEPAAGRLAGGDIGAGRLADPADIVAAAARVLDRRTPATWPAPRVVVTAGGTREPIDAVRVIANRSSGKQGYAVAAEAAARGAEVTLVSTVELPVPAGVRVEAVETAAEMQAAVRPHADADVIVMAAAVADFRPKRAADGQAQEARRRAGDRARADAGHPRRPRGDQAPGSGPRRVRRRDRRPRGQRPVQAGGQAPRPDRRQRRQRPRRRLRPRHQRRRAAAARS